MSKRNKQDTDNALEESVTRHFQAMVAATRQNELGLVKTTRLDGTPAYLVCVLAPFEEGQGGHLFPIAEMLTVDAREQFNPPEGTTVTSRH